MAQFRLSSQEVAQLEKAIRRNESTLQWQLPEIEYLDRRLGDGGDFRNACFKDFILRAGPDVQVKLRALVRQDRRTFLQKRDANPVIVLVLDLTNTLIGILANPGDELIVDLGPESIPSLRNISDHFKLAMYEPHKERQTRTSRWNSYSMVWRPRSPDMDDLMRLATMARELALHYGGFNVGGLGLFKGRVSVSNTEAREVFVFLGANTKRTRDEPKDCAEMEIMRFATATGETIDEFLILGQPRKEDTTATLHPCEVCRKLMRSHIKEGRVVRPTTRITCVNVLNNAVERFTIESLHTVHGESLTDD